MFKTREELLATIGIEEAGLSTKACDILKKKNVSTLSQMIKLEKRDFNPEVSSDIIEEIIQASSELDLKPTYIFDKEFQLPKEYIEISTEAADKLKLNPSKILEYVSVAYYDNNKIDSEAIVKSLYAHEYPRKVLKDKLRSIEHCDRTTLSTVLPSHLLSSTVLEDVLAELGINK